MNDPSLKDGAELFTSPGSCILPMYSKVQLDEYTSYTRVGGYKRVSAYELVSQARTKSLYAEVNIAPFGVNLFSDLPQNIAAETGLLQARLQNHGMQTALGQIMHTAPAEIRPSIEAIYVIFSRANQGQNDHVISYYASTNMIIIHLKSYAGLGGRNAIGMECLKRALSIPGIKNVTIVSARTPYIQVPS